MTKASENGKKKSAPQEEKKDERHACGNSSVPEVPKRRRDHGSSKEGSADGSSRIPAPANSDAVSSTSDSPRHGGVPRPRPTEHGHRDSAVAGTSPGMVWKLGILSGPAKKRSRRTVPRFKFYLKCLNRNVLNTDFSLTSEVGWWLEGIVAEAYKRVGGLGAVTIVPTSELILLFSDVFVEELKQC